MVYKILPVFLMIFRFIIYYFSIENGVSRQESNTFTIIVDLLLRYIFHLAPISLYNFLYPLFIFILQTHISLVSEYFPQYSIH